MGPYPARGSLPVGDPGLPWQREGGKKPALPPGLGLLGCSLNPSCKTNPALPSGELTASFPCKEGNLFFPSLDVGHLFLEGCEKHHAVEVQPD